MIHCLKSKVISTGSERDRFVVKCHQYWPVNPDSPLEMPACDLKVELMAEEKPQRQNHLVERTLRVFKVNLI